MTPSDEALGLPLFNSNEVITRVEPEVSLPKRYIFSRVSPGSDEIILRIDNSSLEMFNTCPRSAMYKLVLGRGTVGGAALLFGNYFHECLEHAYKNGFTEETFRANVKLLEQRFVSTPFPTEEWRTLELAIKLLQKYYNRYQLDLDTFKPIFVEKSFSLPLCTLEVSSRVPWSAELLLGEMGNDEHVYISKLHVYWSGKTDLAMQSVVNDTINVWDHKTTSIMGDSFVKSFELSQQTVGYVWAARHLLGMTGIPGFVLNALGIRKPSKYGTEIELERYPFIYSADRLAEWELDMQYLVLDFIAHLKQGYFPKSTQWCFGKYSQCPYWQVCRVDTTEDRNLFLMSGAYRDVTWTPFNENKTNIE